MTDPVKGCDVYKNIGCAHVDGFLCDYPNCSILKDYKMNERIKELADQAELTIRTSTGTYMSHPEFNKKFAELIVQECADVANQHMEHNEGTDYNVGGKIKQHFGVE